MALSSPTTIGAVLYTIPFIIIALHSLNRYLKDRKNSEKKHVFYAFLCFSVAFTSSFIAYALVLPDMSRERDILVTFLFKLFDVVNMIGVFWLFVFLSDFMEKIKKYLPYVIIHLALTCIVIAVMPFDVKIDGANYIRERAELTSLSILFFWLLYWGIIAYRFWKHSGLMTKKIAIRRSRTMAVGGIIAVFAYICAILSNVVSSAILVYSAVFCGIFAGVVFYAGFIAPERLRRIWNK